MDYQSLLKILIDTRTFLVSEFKDGKKHNLARYLLNFSALQLRKDMIF